MNSLASKVVGSATTALDVERARMSGRDDAAVTIVEYASMTCPHCGAFHAGVLLEVKKSLVDTGRARLVFRDFPLDKFGQLSFSVKSTPSFVFQKGAATRTRTRVP